MWATFRQVALLFFVVVFFLKKIQKCESKHFPESTFTREMLLRAQYIPPWKLTMYLLEVPGNPAET